MEQSHRSPQIGAWNCNTVGQLAWMAGCLNALWKTMQLFGMEWPDKIPPLSRVWPQTADTAAEILLASCPKAATQTSWHTDMLAHDILITGVVAVTLMEHTRTCWYLYRFSTDYCCLLHGIFVARERHKGAQEGEVLPLLNQIEEQPVCELLKGEEGRGEFQFCQIATIFQLQRAGVGKFPE